MWLCGTHFALETLACACVIDMPTATPTRWRSFGSTYTWQLYHTCVWLASGSDAAGWHQCQHSSTELALPPSDIYATTDSLSLDGRLEPLCKQQAHMAPAATNVAVHASAQQQDAQRSSNSLKLRWCQTFVHACLGPPLSMYLLLTRTPLSCLCSSCRHTRG